MYLTALKQRSLSRLKTLQINCRLMGYDMARPGNYARKRMPGELSYMLVDRQHHVVLNSIPKTGSTTWRFALFNNSLLPGFHGLEQLQHGQKLREIHGPKIFENTSTTPAKLMKKEELLKCLNSYYIVLTVRHPFDRVESTYMDKIVRNNMQNLRQKLLGKRGLGKRDIKELAKDGKNIKFEEFLQHMITEGNPHWTSIFKLTYPCSIPYRYLDFKKYFICFNC